MKTNEHKKNIEKKSRQLLQPIIATGIIAISALSIIPQEALAQRTPPTPITTPTPTPTSSSTLDTSLFRSLVSSSTTTCTLSNGSSTTCYELTFNVNEIRDGSGDGTLVDDETGPFCPSSYTGTDGGIGIYDGDTGAGFQNLTQTLWDNMETDGYDLIDEAAGVICTQDPGTGVTVGDNCTAACLEGSPDDDLTVTYLIPVTPENLSEPTEIGSVEPVGVSLDGIPLTGTPPSVVDGPSGMGGNVVGGNIPSLDYCGGHQDPAGYYHWHFIPESADLVHAEYGTDSLADCSQMITQDSAALSGYAKDGYPIYAYQDLIAGTVSTPTDLDECNGHTGETEEFPNGIYHYHASLEAPNMPSCTTGAFVEQQSSPVVQ